jgi:hypothetical protein
MDVDMIKGKHKKGDGKKGGGKFVVKGKEKGKSPPQLCYWCGKPGHVEKECWQKQQGKPRVAKGEGRRNKGKGVHAVTNDDEKKGDNPVHCVTSEEEQWILALTGTENKNYELAVFLDSACFDHVCPMDFMPEAKLEACDGTISSMIRTADGTAMVYAGDKVANLCVLDQNRAELDLSVRFRVLRT